ncbi:hypothetical protein PIROE2DRAFT_58123 [Piromyces sp. E2]|nr:hypothetical protein PIROE2DRAFT_58123 [Piromyces sp. E2]|eukprot:OUM68355.1 hypothetical protein PIROE2DRAFT_58123 [Piromyces sp. E2]
MKILLLTILIILLFINTIGAHTYESLGIDDAQKQENNVMIANESVLPVINISTRNNTELILSREIYTDCVVDVLNVEDNLKLQEKSASIKLRGNSSSFYGDVKKVMANQVPYRIKFDEKINVLGLHHGEKFKDWVLLKTEGDVIRNDIAFRMGRIIFGDKYYVSDSKFVKLYINDTFKGIYLLVEQNEIDKKKVNVSVPEKNYNGTDIGYYFEIDNYYNENPGKYFIYDYGGVTIKDIRGVERKLAQVEFTVKSDFYCQEQLDFIGNYTTNVFSILYHAIEKGEYKTMDENYNLVNSTFTSAEETISAVLDIESAVNMYLLYEIVHDNDVGEGSFFFAIDFSRKSKIQKLQMVSPWDFNWTYGDSPRRYWAAAFCEASFAKRMGDRSNPWFILLGKEEWFHELVSKKWESLSSSIRAEVINEKNHLIDNINDISLVGKNVMDGVDSIDNWLNKRFNWIDEAFVPGQSVSVIPVEKEPIVINPITIRPVVTEPVVTVPVVTEPVVTEPIITEPVVTKPVVSEPVVTEPVVSEKPNIKYLTFDKLM